MAPPVSESAVDNQPLCEFGNRREFLLTPLLCPDDANVFSQISRGADDRQAETHSPRFADLVGGRLEFSIVGTAVFARGRADQRRLR